MKKLKITSIVIGVIFSMFLISSCKTESKSGKYSPSAVIDMKSGAQLWGENCIRCHNTPSPSSYNDTDWSTIELHMRIRANLTEKESKKIFEFLKSAN